MGVLAIISSIIRYCCSCSVNEHLRVIRLHLLTKSFDFRLFLSISLLIVRQNKIKNLTQTYLIFFPVLLFPNSFSANKPTRRRNLHTTNLHWGFGRKIFLSAVMILTKKQIYHHHCIMKKMNFSIWHVSCGVWRFLWRSVAKGKAVLP